MNDLCPLHSAEKRLYDGLNLWVEAKSRYFSPDSFRLGLNSVIQTLRTVTFVLQKHKNDFAGFEAWYSPWQDTMRNDPLMKWLVDSRNIIEKQGDLETHSRAKVSLVESWLDSPSLELEVPPFTETDNYAVLIDKIIPKDIDLSVGLIKVERRWVDSRMPDEEILTILAHAFNVLSQLLYDAHIQLIENPKTDSCQFMEISNTSKGRIPPCMLGLDWDRTQWFKVKDGSIIIPDSKTVSFSRKEAEAARERYGFDATQTQNQEKITDLKTRAQTYFESAKLILKKDGYHIPIALLYFPNGRRSAVNLRMDERSDKHLVIRHLAADVEKHGATSILLINEAWLSTKTSGYAEHDPERKECLQLVAADSEGNEFTHTVIFSRNNEGMIVFGDELEGLDIVNLIQPIRNAWEKQK